MPTNKPRITITLTEEQHDILSTVAQLQDVSMSSIVTDLIETTMPSFQRMAVMLEMAQQAHSSLLRELGVSLEDATRAIAPEAEIDSRQFDLLDSMPGLADNTRASVRARVSARPGAASVAKTARPPLY